ncbi:MAG: hypothetical protein ABL982_09625 [Vicinamibacterales bacterium]
MTHLSPDTFMDLLEGALAEEAVPHLASCDSCRQQLADLRVTWQAAADVEVPEPSPLFWDHLSTRVHHAVSAEMQPRARWWRIDWSWTSVGLGGAAVAALALVAFLQLPRNDNQTSAASAVAADAGVSAFIEASQPGVLPDDESIDLIADLASDLDWDGVAQLGLASVGGAERAALEMTADERIELQRLLREELGPSGT